MGSSQQLAAGCGHKDALVRIEIVALRLDFPHETTFKTRIGLIVQSLSRSLNSIGGGYQHPGQFLHFWIGPDRLSESNAVASRAAKWMTIHQVDHDWLVILLCLDEALQDGCSPWNRPN